MYVTSVDGLPTTEEHAKAIAVHRRIEAKVVMRANESFSEWSRRVEAQVDRYYRGLERARERRARQREFEARTRARVAELLEAKTVEEMDSGERTLWGYVQVWDMERAERNKQARERRASAGGAS